MPIYEYECKNCNHHFELMQKVTEAPLKQCPQCLQDTIVKLVSAAGFQLKGTGWYVTDFKNKPTPETKKTENSTENNKSTGSEEKKSTDAKSETTNTTPTNTKIKGETD